jgi:hypothetical protein
VTLAVIATIGFGIQVIAWLVGPVERQTDPAIATSADGFLAGQERRPQCIRGRGQGPTQIPAIPPGRECARF